jgi:eukaryotic-like serine/threonine-protein kinase
MPLSIDEFCRDLAEIGLLTPADVSQVVEALPPERRPQDTLALIRELVRVHRLTTYQAQQVYQGKGKGLLLGNYLVLDKIGQGGMGVVLKAEHKRMRRIVALKLIRLRTKGTKGQEATARRFHREVEAAAKLIHPNIVTAFDADEADGVSFLVMEFVDGVDLSTLVKLEGPLPVDMAIDCILQTARGLEYAHIKGVVHRDIKPRNLLLDRDGVVKILDMGLARVETSSGIEQTDLTGTGQIMGTIDYMAPEQAVNPKLANQQADVYSLGITLWYLLTGRHLYEGDTVLERLVAHRERPIPSLVKACPDATPELEAVFHRMVAKRPQHRYPSMTELIAELDRCRLDATAARTVQFDPAEGQQLQQFLKGIEPAAAGRAAPQRAAAAPAVATPSWTFPTGETVIDSDSINDTDPDTDNPAFPAIDASLSGVRKKLARNADPKRDPAIVVIVAVLLAAIVATLVVLYVFRDSLKTNPVPRYGPPQRTTAWLDVPLHGDAGAEA